MFDDDAECLKPLAGQSERRRSSNNRRIHLSPISVALSGMTSAGSDTPGIASTRPGTPSECQTCGGHPSTTPRLSRDCTRAAYFPPYCDGSECWRIIEGDLNKLSTFHAKNRRRILRISWPETISNQHLARCNRDSMCTIIMQKVMEMDRTCDEKRARKHPPHSPSLDTRREAETMATQEHLASNCGKETQDPPSHLGTIQKLAQNRQEWGTLVAALHASRHNGHEWNVRTVGAIWNSPLFFALCSAISFETLIDSDEMWKWYDGPDLWKSLSVNP